MMDDRPTLTLRAVLGMLTGRGGRRPHLETVRRWITHGCKLPDGSMARLKAVRICGTWMLKEEWVRDFARMRMLGGMVTA